MTDMPGGSGADGAGCPGGESGECGQDGDSVARARVSARRAHWIAVPALDRRLPCHEDETVFAAARREGLRVVGACGGRGACGTCVVRVLEGRVHREGEGAHRKWLRACRIQPRSDLVIEVAPRSLARIVRADVDMVDDHDDGGGSFAPRASAPHGSTARAFAPRVFARTVKVPAAGLHDLAGDAERIRRALPADEAGATIGYCAAGELPRLLRAHDWTVDLRIMRAGGGEAHVIGAAPPGSPLLGLAVDLGTTNVAAFLVDLRNGRRLASLALENPQVAWGADLISRINHAIRDAEVARALGRAAVGVINALAHDLARAVDAGVGDIVELAVCGNTAMQHLLVGWPVAQLGRAPFVPASNEAQDLPAAALGLQLAGGAHLHLAASVGGFVGGDHVAAMLATEPIWSAPGTTLVMDIGTNTEISLVHGGRIRSASCPSGPALEGGHVSGGMRAAEGAIERVSLGEDGRLRLKVIGDGEPVGLCGSGVLDAMASFVRAGWVDGRGRIAAHAADPTAGTGKSRAITLTPEAEATPAVRFTQDDVRAVQLAKSAIRTGARLLLAEAGVAEQAVDRFVIAGAFGAYIDVDSAVAIGLLPDLPRERFMQVGNAAGLGVRQMLTGGERRARAAALARECEYVELSTRPAFQRTFLAFIGLSR